MIRPTTFGAAFYNASITQAMLPSHRQSPLVKMVSEAVLRPGNGMLKVLDYQKDAGVIGRPVQRG